MRGVWANASSSSGEITCILLRSGDYLRLNDLIFDTMDSADSFCRPGFASDPHPDFWADNDNAANALKTLRQYHE